MTEDGSNAPFQVLLVMLVLHLVLVQYAFDTSDIP